MRRPIAGLAVLVAMIFCSTSVVRSDDKPSGVTIGEMRIQTIPAVTFLCTPAESTFEKMGEPIKEGFDKVFYAASQAKLLIARPTMIVYQGGPHFEPTKTFKMELGIIVQEDAKVPDAPDGVTIRKVEPFKCATILYTGTVNRQGEAYQKLIPALKAAGLTPTGEEREMCLYWEGLDSANNVFQMQIGIK